MSSSTSGDRDRSPERSDPDPFGIETDDDLAAALALALRQARRDGDAERVRLLAVTLRRVADAIALDADPSGEYVPAITHYNGRPDPMLIAPLVLRRD